MIILSQITSFFKRVPRWLLTLVCIVVILVLGWFDFQDTTRTSIDYLYTLPVIATAWYVNRRAGVSIALLATGVWSAANSFDGDFKGSILSGIVNSFSVGGIFLTLALSFSALKREVVELTQIASLDHLTGLYNRRFFYKSVTLETARSARDHSAFSIALIDVDNFKLINDTLGHKRGDEALIKISRILKNHTRQTDTVARIGGDEFVLLLPETDHDQSKKVVSKLMVQLSEDTGYLNIPITLSIGVVTFMGNPCPVDTMISMADELMYEVKNNSKNGALFKVDSSCDG